MNQTAATADTQWVDPHPYIVTYNGVESHRTSIFKSRFVNGLGEIVIRLKRPRTREQFDRDQVTGHGFAYRGERHDADNR